MLTSWPLLSLLVWLPVIGGIVNLFLLGDRRPEQVRVFSLIVTIVSLLLVIMVYGEFDPTIASYQFVERFSWIPTFNIEYYLGVDGIALPLVILTCFTGLIVVIAGWQIIQVRVPEYYAAFLIMQGLMNGVFFAVDAMLFYVFWEAMLIPMFLIIGIWGGAAPYLRCG